jgi:hypothetical protein
LESVPDKGKGNTTADLVVVVDAPVDVSGTTCRVIQSEQTSIDLNSTPDSRPKSLADVIANSHALQRILCDVNSSHNVSINGIALEGVEKVSIVYPCFDFVLVEHLSPTNVFSSISAFGS